MQRWQFEPLISLLLLSEQDWQDLSKHSSGLKHNINKPGTNGMANNVIQDIPELMARAQSSLSAARLLMDNDYLTEAVSRAYYAMFYAATALLHSEGATVAKHSAVISQVGQRFAKTGRLTPHLHRLLLDMFDERQIADYSGAGFDEERVTIDCQNASEFVAAVREYLEKQGYFE